MTIGRPKILKNQKVCLECGESFKDEGTLPSQKGFCSVACKNKYSICIGCGKKFLSKFFERKSGYITKTDKMFCSLECKTQYSNNARFSGKRILIPEECKKAFRKEQQRRYCLTHKEQSKQYYLAHREQKREYRRRYDLVHREEIREYHEEYYRAHREQIKEQSKQYYLAHREQRAHQKLLKTRL